IQSSRRESVMHATKPEQPGEKGSFLSTRLPVAVAVLWAGTVGFFWLWPAGWDRHTRVMAVWSASLLACLGLVALWFLFARIGWGPRLAVPACLAILAFASVRDVQFNGDLKPIVTFRWNRTPDEALEHHRQRQASGDDLPAVDLADASPTNFPEYRGRRRDGI